MHMQTCAIALRACVCVQTRAARYGINSVMLSIGLDWIGLNAIKYQYDIRTHAYTTVPLLHGWIKNCLLNLHFRSLV